MRKTIIRITNRFTARLTALLLTLAMTMAFIPMISSTAYAEDDLSIAFADPTKTEYMVGEPVEVIASGSNVGDAWVGLYYKDENTHPGDGGVNSLRWYWVKSNNGRKVDITADSLWDVRKVKIGPGDYKVVLFGDEDYTDIRDTIYFTVVEEENPDAQDELSLELVDGKDSYLEDEPIYVRATGTAAGAWVGVYKQGDVRDPDHGGVTSYRWFYTADQNGKKVNILSESFDLNNRGDLAAGEYEIVLFGDGGYDNVVKTIPVSITEDPNKDHPIPEDELSLTLEDTQDTYKAGEPVYIRATGIASGAWVGLYRENDVRDPGAGGVPSLRWYYIADHNGEKVNIMDSKWMGERTESITDGSYDIILFGDSGYYTVIKTITITVEGTVDIDPSQFSLETDKTDYLYEESIKVKASGTGIDGNAWIGLYPAETSSYSSNYLYYYYVKDAEDVYTVIQSRSKGQDADNAVGNGKYKVVLFASSGYSLPVLWKEITVTRAAKVLKRLRDPGCVSIGLEYALYDDGSSEYREIPSLGGHDWGAPTHIDGTTKHKYVCSRDDSHTKTESCTYTQRNVIKAASVAEDGIIEYTCDVCGGKNRVSIPRLSAAPVLSVTQFLYTGSNIQPLVSAITDINGNPVSSEFYQITYPADSSATGIYTVRVDFKGDYEGSYSLGYSVLPGFVRISKVKGGKKQFKVNWTKTPESVSGYQISYSTKKNFSKAKYKTVADPNKASLKVKKLKAKKKYYVRIRAYKLVNGSAIYSEWSPVKKVNTKK